MSMSWGGAHALPHAGIEHTFGVSDVILSTLGFHPTGAQI